MNCSSRQTTVGPQVFKSVFEVVLQHQDIWKPMVDAAYYAQNLSLTCTCEPLSVNPWNTHSADSWECLHRGVSHSGKQLLQYLKSSTSNRPPQTWNSSISVSLISNCYWSVSVSTSATVVQAYHSSLQQLVQSTKLSRRPSTPNLHLSASSCERELTLTLSA